MPLVTEGNWYDFVNWAWHHNVVSFDTETTGLRPYHGDQLVGISIGVADTTWYLPFRHEQGPNLPLGYLEWAITYLQDRDQIIGHNTKFDLQMLAREGYQIPEGTEYERDCPVLDTLLGAHLVNENELRFGIKGSGYSLKYLCNKYGIGRGSADEEELRSVVETAFRSEITAARKAGAEMKGSLDGIWKGFMWKLPPDQVTTYAEADVFLTWNLLVEHVWPFLDNLGLVPLFHQVCNYNLLITKMEELGIAVDSQILDRLTEEVEAKAKRAANDLWWATRIDNCNSAPQCSRYFGIPSTKEKILKYAAMEGRVNKNHAELLLETRGLRKVVDSYLIPYHRFLANDGAIHPSFKVHGTATGRLSCSDPNIMALPRDVTNQPAKSVFVARPGYVLVEIDLSQAELRVASHFAANAALYQGSPDRYLKAPGLTNMGAILVRPDSDLHTETMLSMQEHNPDLDRDMAKRVNFSAVYGIGAPKFSNEYAVPLAEAYSALSVWRKVYPEFPMLYEVMNRLAQQQGYIQLPMSGRFRRYTYEGDNYPSKASSNLVQGTVADIMRIIMHKVAAYLVTVGGRILLQVHDSLLLEIPLGPDVQTTVFEVQLIMTDFPFMPPLMAEAKVGRSWGEMKPRETRHDNLHEGVAIA